MTQWHPRTRAVRAGLARSSFDETSEALYLTSGYVYPNAAEAEAAFAGESDHMVYSRFTNPTVSMFADRLADMEGAEACFATSTGMSAVFVALAALCSQGDRIVASRALFGSCFVVVDEVMRRFGVEPTFVDGHDLDQWRTALAEPATAVFFETPSNPMLELVDIPAVSELAHAAGAQVVVDNVFGTPVFSRPLELGADIVVYSATKHFDGQGRVLGGAVLGSREFIERPVEQLVRNLGMSLSPFTAWVLVKGLETLQLLVEHMAASTLEIAGFLNGHPGVSRVWHPFLEAHPQHDLARRQMTGGRHGGDVRGAGRQAGRVRGHGCTGDLRHLQQPRRRQVPRDPSGDNHHRRLGAEGRAAAGITDGVVRLSIGLEDVGDLITDLDQALGSVRP